MARKVQLMLERQGMLSSHRESQQRNDQLKLIVERNAIINNSKVSKAEKVTIPSRRPTGHSGMLSRYLNP